MANKEEKYDDNTLKVTETKEEVKLYDYDELVKTRDLLQASLDASNALIAKADSLGIVSK